MTSSDLPSALPHTGVKISQAAVGGLVLVALAAFAFWAMNDLPAGSLSAMGPGLLPRWLAYGVGLCGAALFVSALVRRGHPVEESGGWRGPLFVCVAIILFAILIRPFAFGSFRTPGLGLAFAGPLSIVVGGYASPEARLRELLVLGLALTAFCIVLFGDLLNLPIPMFPQWMAELFPSGWSQKAALRGVTAVQALVALGIWLPGRRSASAPVDVAPHSVQIR